MKTSDRIHRFQNLDGTITYTSAHLEFIQGLNPLAKEDWDKGLSITKRPRGTIKKRYALKMHIKQELRKIQFPHCIYCGFHEKIVGNLQRDHIAPKDSYPQFMFESENLVLACASCNGFLKKSNFDSVSRRHASYSRCSFKIIHPYRDKYADHLDFRFSDNSVFIKHKKHSRKGKTTIQLFDLNDIKHAEMRGGAIMRKIKLPPELEALVQAVMDLEYSS